ncbi:MAG: transglycosylase SLT domain-containing protein [Deltaproteobacteria bacterium]|nr:transglycosylase SLT domain-containing protein [Deltaproteobacteria bacterium]
MLTLLASLSLATPLAVATGDCDAVRAELTAPSSPGERLTLAGCARPGDDLDLRLSPLEGGPLASYGRLLRAQATVGHAPGAAADLLVGLDLPAATLRDARLLRGRALVAAGRSLEARDDLRALLDTSEGDEARYWLAVGGQDRGDTQAAIATFRRAWASSTRGPWSGLSAERLSALGAPVPDLESPEGRALVRDRIKALQGDYQHREALALIVALEAKEPPTGATAQWSAGRARFRGKDYPGAIALWGQVLGAPESCAGGADSLHDYALAYARTGDYATAAGIYTRLIAQHPAATQADTGSYKLGFMALDAGDEDRAVALFAEHLTRYPASAHGDEALWFTGRAHWRAGRQEQAVAAWGELVRRYPSSGLAPGARYWTARAAGQRGDAAAEREGLEAVIRAYPVSGHAWLAATRLGWRWAPKPAVAPPPWPEALRGRPELARAQALTEAGLERWAREELRALSPAATGREARLALAYAAIDAGDYTGAMELAGPYCGKPWEGGDPVAMRACVPRPAEALVSEIAARSGLPPLLPYGIMQAESALKPWVSSAAGARGLMQLMPEVGERLFLEEHPGGAWDAERLFRPTTNALLGTAELSERYLSLAGTLEPDHLPAVIASYNAGEEAVRRWLPEDGSAAPFDSFAEDISYTETRRYVRTVLGALMRWSWVYATPVEPE